MWDNSLICHSVSSEFSWHKVPAQSQRMKYYTKIRWSWDTFSYIFWQNLKSNHT